MKNRVSDNELKILKFLDRYKDPDTGKCTPVVAEIASAVGLSDGHVRKITTKLHQRGIIEKVERWAIDNEDDPGSGRIEIPPEKLIYAQNHAWNRPFKIANLYRIIKRDLLLHGRAIMSTLWRGPHLSNDSTNLLNA
jgi:hypothetical protein